MHHPGPAQGLRGQARDLLLPEREGPARLARLHPNAKRLREGDQIGLGRAIRAADKTMTAPCCSVSRATRRSAAARAPGECRCRPIAVARGRRCGRDDTRPCSTRKAPSPRPRRLRRAVDGAGRGGHRPRPDPPWRQHLYRSRRQTPPTTSARRVGVVFPPIAARLNGLGGPVAASSRSAPALRPSKRRRQSRTRIPCSRRHRIFIPRLGSRAVDRPRHQFPSAALDPVHAGLGTDGSGRGAAAYAHAIERAYRFYSYGDASLFSQPETA
jgi:hypothetical protein